MCKMPPCAVSVSHVRRNLMRTFVVLVSLISLCLFTSFAFAAPDLKVEAPTFNFGEIYQGDKVPHVFEFTNQGEDPLLIDRVRSSWLYCGSGLREKHSSRRQRRAEGQLRQCPLPWRHFQNHLSLQQRSCAANSAVPS